MHFKEENFLFRFHSSASSFFVNLDDEGGRNLNVYLDHMRQSDGEKKELKGRKLHTNTVECLIDNFVCFPAFSLRKRERPRTDSFCAKVLFITRDKADA